MMMNYFADMFEAWGLKDGTVWMWAVLYGLPCWVMGMWLVVNGFWGRRRRGVVKCGGCEKVLDGGMDEGRDVCEGCGYDLCMKKGVVWGRMRSWRVVMLGVLVGAMPLASWGVMLGVIYYQMQTRQHRPALYMKHMSDYELIDEFADTNVDGTSYGWLELIKRQRNGRLSNQELERLAGVFCDARVNTYSTNYDAGILFLEAHEKGMVTDEMELKLSEKAYAFNNKRWQLGELKIERVEGGVVHCKMRVPWVWGFLMAERLVAVKEVKVDGEAIGFEMDWEKSGEMWRVLRLKMSESDLAEKKDREVKMKLRLAYIGLLESGGVDWRTKEEDWPEVVLSDEEVEVMIDTTF
ncbi:hypothetical protein JD969_07510 [Planctomycetota bacterium]|nr:hypothetical protein JD969_07510 [Planctomycetota bacterium]